jgi:hypothetical protein
MLRWKRGHDGANCITSLTETASNWCVIWKVSSLSRAFQYSSGRYLQAACPKNVAWRRLICSHIK